MNRKMKGLYGLLAALVAVLASVGPVEAQMWFFPDYALPSSNGTPATWVAATYGRGLNDSSGKVNAFGGVIGRTTEKASFLAGVGQGRRDGNSEITLGGSAGLDVMQGENSTVTVQGGIGWFSTDIGTESATALRFPIGVALKGAFQSPEAMIAPWIMPRVNITRLSGTGDSTTETDFGASGGVSFTFPNGFGVHTALDLLLADSNNWLFGIGAHYVLGGGGA